MTQKMLIECDRCSKSSEDRRTWLPIVTNPNSELPKYIDLCPDCAKAFGRFLVPTFDQVL